MKNILLSYLTKTQISNFYRLNCKIHKYPPQIMKNNLQMSRSLQQSAENRPHEHVCMYVYIHEKEENKKQLCEENSRISRRAKRDK